MTSSPDARVSSGATLLRIPVASVFVVHGITRVANGTVGGAKLAAGRCVVPLASWFALQIAVGIVMVHAQNGWFVVGAGTGGVEYTVLIIAVLVATALTDRAAHRLGGSR